MPPRRQRAAAQAAAASLRTPTPQVVEPSDDEAVEQEEAVPSEAADSPATGDDAAASPTQTSDIASGPSTPAPFPAPPRRRRLGRPPKNRPPDWDTLDPNDSVDGSTPRKRRGRPPGSGPGRWPKNRHLVPQVTQLAVDKAGTMVDVVDDEAVLPDDEEGETKVDKNGNLAGGREYRCRTFTLLGKGKRLYMLSTEPARCIGFRDSYLFFQKHPVLYKFVIDDAIKHDMIDRDLMPHSYKGRTIGVVTARSVFREFGAQIIIGGKRIIDDYNVQKAREEGAVEGELAVPGDILPKEGEEYNKNQYVAWHGASAVYHTGGPSIPTQNGKVPDPKKRKVVITDANWMLEHARACSQYNSTLTDRRREAWNGSYDIYTNSMHFPAHTQPTKARWEHIKDEQEPGEHLTNGLSQEGGQANGEDSGERRSIFTNIPLRHTRKFAIIDTQSQNPSQGVVTAASEHDNPNRFGSNSIMDIDNSLVDLLPPECRTALLEARQRKADFQKTFANETTDGLRNAPRPGGLA